MSTPAIHLVTRMRMNDGRILERIPSSLTHAYLGLAPEEVNWHVLGHLMRERGWTGPKHLYIKSPRGQQIVRGFEREVQA